MYSSKRQGELEKIIQDTFLKNPELKEALEIFQMGQEHYSKAIAGMTTVTITSTNTTNPGVKNRALLDKN